MNAPLMVTMSRYNPDAGYTQGLAYSSQLSCSICLKKRPSAYSFDSCIRMICDPTLPGNAWSPSSECTSLIVYWKICFIGSLCAFPSSYFVMSIRLSCFRRRDATLMTTAIDQEESEPVRLDTRSLRSLLNVKNVSRSHFEPFLPDERPEIRRRLRFHGIHHHQERSDLRTLVVLVVRRRNVWESKLGLRVDVLAALAYLGGPLASTLFPILFVPCFLPTLPVSSARPLNFGNGQ